MNRGLACEQHRYKWQRAIKRLDPAAVFFMDGTFITNLSLETVAGLMRKYGY